MRKKVALVTGATSELGKKIIGRLSSEGYRVYAGMSSPKKSAYSPHQIKFVRLDITKNSQIKKLFKRVDKESGQLDVLVNVAGITINGPAVELEEEDFVKMLNVNVLGAYRMIKQFFPLLKNSKNANVINITSLAGVAAFPNSAAYCASKHALEALGQGMRSELLRDGIWLTNVAPGAIVSGKKVKLDFKPMREKYKLVKLLMPLATVDEVTSAVLQAIESKRPPMRILVGNDTKLVNLVKKILPNSLWDKFVLLMWK